MAHRIQHNLEELRAEIARKYTYNPKSGTFVRNAYPRARNPGKEIQANRNGYVTLDIKGDHIGAHRIVWWLETGEFPTMDVDHINGQRNDNKISNLRHVSHAGNAQGHRIIKSKT